MIKSNFINDILNLLLDGDKAGLKAKPQQDFISIKDIEYTGSGAFIMFNHIDGIENNYATDANLVLNGLTIKSPELNIAAEATLVFKDGLINYLEIWSYDGEYPEKDLSQYTLTQEWEG